MATNKIQYKISISSQLGALIEDRAHGLGLPVTQYLKHLVLKDIERGETYPVYKASEETERLAKEAMEHPENFVEVTDLDEFFENL